MRWNRTITTTAFGAIALATALAVVPSSADAQLARRRATERLLFMIPQSQGEGDQEFVVEVASETRDELISRLRGQIITITSEDICRVLEESAYQCDVSLNPADAERLAQAMRSDAYVIGWMWRQEEDAPALRMRMVDVRRRTGLSGWTTVESGTNVGAVDFAQLVVDSLEHQMEAANWARECAEKRDRGDFDDAMERAQRAFAIYQNHPSAAMCAEVVSEVMGEPLENQIAYLLRAVRGDSLLDRAWERLGRLYRQQGDSVAALAAFANQSRAKPNDRQLRMGVIAGAITTAQFDVGRELADEWLEANPADLEMLQLKARACVEGGLWECALDALTAQYDIDSSLVGDSVFYQQIIGAAQSLGNTTAQLEWSGEAVLQVPESRSLLRAHATALVTEASTASAVAEVETDRNRADSLAAAARVYNDSAATVYELLLSMDPTDVRSALAGARVMLESMVIDTLTPLDTARLMRGGAFLDAAIQAAPQDTSVLMNAAVMYYQKGSALVQTRQVFDTAVDWLERAVQYDVLGRLTTQSNFFLGLGLMFKVFEFDPMVTESESCELVEEEARMIARGKQAMTIGAELSPGTAEQILGRFQTMEDRIPNLRQAYECP